ncbi:MAG: hypothetical protein HXY34_13455 [Candidatus Thorarchaeota archaeon]|nr:hypothetical protein [Candidatus Thorarchaeota archaeon]
MTQVVLLDTNFLLLPAQCGLDIFVETERTLETRVRFVVLSSSLSEIDSKMTRLTGGVELRQFRIARELVRKCDVIEVDPALAGLAVDEQLLVSARSMGAVLATNDDDLRQRARAQGVPVLTARGHKRLMLDGSAVL